MLVKAATNEKVLEAVDQLSIPSGKTLFLLLGEKGIYDLPAMKEALKARGVPFFGALFSSVIYGDKKYDDSAVLTLIELEEKPYIVEGLNGEDPVLPEVFTQPLFVEKMIDRTALVLVDGLTSHISSFLTALYDHFGPGVNYVGGGAGSLSFVQKPCLFTEDGIYQDAAIVAFLRHRISLGVRHGWRKVEGLLVATKSHKNVICQLNWENAFEVYKKVVEKDAAITLTKDNFFDVAKGYPFGLVKENLECIVRDPIAVNEEGHLICVGEVPEDATLDILKGENKELIDAAAQAAADCFRDPKSHYSGCLIFDCISRVLFMEEDFERELSGVLEIVQKEVSTLPVGALTLGEISSYGDGFLEFFNKTMVVGILYEG
ncbi:FIST signal transduction protein [Heliorestis convoluta]|uniref:Histidine kinase, putative n=1 Tax=Heliorestis convoluta TaxID=356322 RepID=A0A5Q2N4R9_9FIRM|nr:FIST N-terminal domain-containing protein [Heliorestis convoluta]QGG48606.1 histidine kinase, putative [Heliorestis convoluta]